MAKKNIDEYITAKELKEDVDFLVRNDCGCCRHEIGSDKDGNNWFILVGWQDGFEKVSKEDCTDGYASDETWRIATKIGYQSANNIMQCDFDVDFTMPYNEETGEVDDTCIKLPKCESETDWEIEAAQLNKFAEIAIKDYELE